MKTIASLLLFIVVITGCKKETPDNPSDDNLFVSVTSVGSFSSTIMQGFAASAGYTSFIPLLKYDVDYFKFIYKTTYKGNTIEASGMIGIPKNIPVTPSLLSAQHGTMFKDTDAPSNFPATFTGFELFASAGFVTVIPDFIGFGVSKDIVHPYYDQELSGTSVVDMIKAAKTYLSQQNISVSNRLFLVGYSEGGYVTMAAQKEIETHPEHNLTLTGAAEGAGGYDLQGMLTGIATTPSYGDPSFLANIIQSYNTTYDWKRPYTDFFQQPYADKIPALLDGTKNSDEINAELTTSPAALFNPVFYANLINPTGETVLKQAIQTNTFLDWYPKSPTRLYHGTADQSVFYQTSQTTYDRFITAGATKVEFIPIPGGTHETSIEPMMLNALPWLQSLDK